jgi:protein disulfide-isomerase A6
VQSEYAGGRKCAKAVRLTLDTDFSKMRVGQMRDILRDRGLSCLECVEKQDFVAKLRELVQAA